MTRRPFESPYIFGIHEPGGEQYMLEAGRPGWVLFTEGIGRDPYNRSGRDYRSWAARDLGVMVRLNHGYYPLGTIPPSDEHPNFARRCANFVAASQGCHIWIIGNEMNYAAERPGIGIRSGPRLLADDPAHADPFLRGLPSRFGALNPVLAMADARTRSAEGEIITPEVYARCYRLCREAIHQVPGHEEDLVLVGAVAPWNVDTRYSGNPSGDWVRYFRDILLLLGPEGCDGITLHAYTHGPDPQLIQDETRLSTFSQYHQQFRVYQDFLQAVPANMRHLPVYITETNQGDPWLDANNGWVKAAYAEIHAWNSRPDTQKIRALVLYRWPRMDKWYIEGKRGVIADFREALQHDYRWDQPPDPSGLPPYGVEWVRAEIPAPLHAGDTVVAPVTVRNVGALPWPAQGANPVRLTYRFYRNRVEVELPQARDPFSDLPHDVPPGGTVTIQARIALPPEPGSYTLELDLVHQGVTRFSDAGAPVLRHWVTLRPTPVAVPSSSTPGQEVTPVEPPPIIDIRRKLPRGDQPYQRRSLRQVRYLILNHTAAPPTMPVQEIAQAHVQAGYPGIAYDYFVQADGTIYQVSDLEEVIQADAIWSGGGINICLEGNFNEEPPAPPQLEATARLCAWLVDHLGLTPEAIVGLRELIQTTSPGDTFLEGPGWKQALVERVRQLLGQGTPVREPALASTASRSAAAAGPAAEPVFPAAGEAVLRPPIQDVVHRLPRDPIRMARRRAEDIRYVVINHTAGPADLSLEVIARAFRERLPGILYQYYITADGTIYQTQPLLEAVEGEKPYIFNAINIGFAGDFTDTVPTTAQILAGGWLIAWLLQQFPGLTMDAVKGVQEFISHSSPGRQWLEGRRWKDLLLNAVRQVQSGILAEEAVSAELAQPPSPPPRRSVSASPPTTGELDQLRQENRALREQTQTLQQENQDLRQELGRLQAELSRIQEAHEQLVQEMEKQRESSPATAPLGPPPIHDMVDRLPRHPTLRYEQRSRREITHLVIHHTGAPLHVGPEQIAELHIEEDPDQGKVAWPGIGYHFFIHADGRIDQTNRLETVSYHVAGHNRASVGIAFAGSFMAGSVPTERQIQAGAHLIAWLMHELGIPPSNVVGHQEFPDNDTTCPGLEWRQGRRWREELFRELTRLLSGQGGRPIYHYMLFSPRSDPRSKVSTYLRHAVSYIERFRPTVGFRVEEAMLAHYVTIVGDESRVSVQDEQRLREAGVAVERLPGANEVDTARVLSELVERRRRFWALDEEG